MLRSKWNRIAVCRLQDANWPNTATFVLLLWPHLRVCVRVPLWAPGTQLTWSQTQDLLRCCQRQWSTAVPAELKRDAVCDPRPAAGSNRPLGREFGGVTGCYKIIYLYSWFQTFAMLWMFILLGGEGYFPACEFYVPTFRHIKFRRREIAQKK